MKRHLGTKYYTILKEGTVNIIRLFEINEDELVFKNDSNGNKVILSEKELNDDYIALNPDAIIAFNIVQLIDDQKDIIVTMYRKDEIKNNDNIPYAICRQNIFDVFTNTTNTDENVMYIGLSISKDSIPDSMEMEMMLACNDVIKTDIISAYIDDTLLNLLSLIDSTEYDEALDSMYKKDLDITFKGNCSTIESLLKENNFMYDFKTGFNIESVDFEIKTIQDTDTLIPDQCSYFESLLGKVFIMTYVVIYDKSMNLSKLESDYILVSDKTDTLYVIAYDSIILESKKFDNTESILDYMKTI